jgi:ectoine hydroxylase-related dioxygenase (phytanoyl-CoA dioxygenase family)
MPLLVYVGLILSFPGSEDQPWHQDGMPLFSEDDFDSSDLPPYALNIFLPLTDQDMSVEVGPTEFIPGSHIMTEQQAMSIVEGSEQTGPLTVVSPVVRSGDALIYDYRVCHRGTSNLTHVCDQGKVRKILYLMYARPWFKEHLNFGTENLFDQHDGGIPE